MYKCIKVIKNKDFNIVLIFGFKIENFNCLIRFDRMLNVIGSCEFGVRFFVVNFEFFNIFFIRKD